MTRKLLFTSFLVLSTALAFAQAQVHRPPLRILHWKPAAHAAMPAAAPMRTGLPLFDFHVTSTRDGNQYAGAIVGNNPFNEGGGAVRVRTQIVPLVIVTNAVAKSISPKGIISTTPGVVTTFNPTVPDNSCLAAPNNVPVKVLRQSPIFQPADFNFGGTDVGTTQYIDAFQRAEFWDVIDQSTYHTLLDPVKVLAPITINVPDDHGLSLPPALFGACGPMAIVDINLIDSVVTNQILPTLASQGVNPGTFPIFMLYNAAMSIGNPKNLNNCCALGYHNIAATFQTYSPADFDTTGLFGPGALDTAVMAHEVGEWANDPSTINPTPAWGHTGQVGGCQNNLEVGDPLTGTLIPNVTMPNGFSYHLQELAFFSWFYGAPSIGLNGWFSDNGTFTTDAGPPCVQ